MKKRLASFLSIFAITIFGLTIPDFVPTSWAKIEPSSWEPQTWPGLDVNVTDAPEAIDSTHLIGVLGQRILNDTVSFQSRFMTVTGSAQLKEQTYDVVKSVISHQEESTEKKFAPEAHKPGSGLADRECVTGSSFWEAKDIFADPALGVAGNGSIIVCDIVFAQGSTIGQKLRWIERKNSEITVDESVVVYVDADSEESFLADALWKESANQYIWDAFIAAMKREVGALGLTWIAQIVDEETIRKALNTTFLGADELFYFTFPKGIENDDLRAIGIAETEQETMISIPSHLLLDHLSERGLKLLGLLQNDQEFGVQYFSGGQDFVDCALVTCVALTYDDGPSKLTPQILDAYAAKHASATFYVLGANIEDYPDVVQRALAEGHMVQNHSWSHKNLTKLSEKEIGSEINRTSTAIYDAIGVVPQTFRPPYGAHNKKVFKVVKMPAILWDVDTDDWKNPDSEVLVSRIVDEVKPGSIVLQHDIHEVTADTIWEVLDSLADRGFTMVNIEQLFNGKIPTEGVFYSAR